MSFFPIDEKNNNATPDPLEFLREMIANRPGGENRPQQEEALNAIQESIKEHKNSLVQAGTGTGKSFATLIPAICSGKRVVYSTATKQLSEQLTNSDIPALKEEFKRQGLPSFDHALLKGRENYACVKKVNELRGIEEAEEKIQESGLFRSDDLEENSESIEEFLEMEPVSDGAGIVESDLSDFKYTKNPSAKQLQAEFKALHEWYDKTTTGDRSEAPPVSDKAWKGFSVNNNECVGRKVCPFAEECFSEAVKEKAIVSRVVVTNHAVTAIDLMGEQGNLLGDREVYIFDEVHELDSFMSNSWGTTLTVKMILDSMSKIKKSHAFFDNSAKPKFDAINESIDSLCKSLENNLETLDHGLLYPNHLPYNVSNTLASISTEFSKITSLSMKDEQHKELVKREAGNVCESIFALSSTDPENVVWVTNEALKKDDSKFNKKKKDSEPEPPMLHCAPLRIGPKLMEVLDARNATMVGTSATITVGGSFDNPVHNFGFAEYSQTPFLTLDAGTPFDYSKQAMLYVPNPDTFPAPVYPDIREHSEEVERTSLEMVKALGGRTLILTTKTSRIDEIADYIESNLPRKSGIKILRQNSMPAPQVIEAFINDETSVLIATMGMWHGLNAEGATCMGVIIDKIPFPTFDDPLMTARKDYTSSTGGNGFMDVYVANANVKLAQGFGRLVRTMSDRGIVAILDTRMRTKPYGSYMLKSFPHEIKRFNNEEIVLGAANRLREAREKELAEENETPF